MNNAGEGVAMAKGKRGNGTSAAGTTPARSSAPTRRQWLGMLAGLGIGSTTFQRALAVQAQQAAEQQAVTAEMVKQAEWICGLKLSDEERTALAQAMTQTLAQFQRMRAVNVPHDVPPAVHFLPAPWLPPAETAPRSP